MRRVPGRLCAWSRAWLLRGACAATWLVLGGLGGAAAEDAVPPAPAPFTERAAWLGICGVPVGIADDEASRRLAALDGLGVAWLETQPIRWGDVEPRPPDSPVSRYDWKAIDDTVVAAQRAGLAPLLVLSPTCGWAQVAPDACDWARFARESLPEAEARVVITGAAGALPPRPDAHKHWQRFVRDLVERYDGDGQRDMPGLRRPITQVQVLDQIQRPTRWRGSGEDYQRLLHYARTGAEEAHAAVEVVHAAVDLQGLFRAEDGEPDRWRERLEESVPALPLLARLEARRGIEMVLANLAFTQLYDAVPHVGSGNVLEDARNVAALKALLQQRGAPTVAVWLTQGPTRRLARARVALPDDALPPEEHRAREQLLVAGTRGGEEGEARRWLRTGTAYDVVRGAAFARAAGADRVLTYALGDAMDRPPGEDLSDGRLQGFVRRLEREGATATYVPTPAWYAARQLNRLTLGHRSAAIAPLGAPGRVVVFGFSEHQERPWVAVLLPDASLCWATPPGAREATRLVSVPMPDGLVELEDLLLDDGPARRRKAEVRDGLLELEVGCAPLYVLAAPSKR
jgi:hypothetical protein